MTQSMEIKFTQDGGLVLLGLLVRLNAKDDFAFEDQAEQRVLWNLEASLEK